MKNLFFPLFLMAFLAMPTVSTAVVCQSGAVEHTQVEARKPTVKEKLAVRLAKKKMAVAGDSGKEWVVAFLLCFFLGCFGIHRFYLGYNGLGVLYLFTFGIFGIGFLVDFILLLIPNGLTPKGHDTY